MISTVQLCGPAGSTSAFDGRAISGALLKTGPLTGLWGGRRKKGTTCNTCRKQQTDSVCLCLCVLDLLSTVQTSSEQINLHLQETVFRQEDPCLAELFAQLGKKPHPNPVPLIRKSPSDFKPSFCVSSSSRLSRPSSQSVCLGQASSKFCFPKTLSSPISGSQSCEVCHSCSELSIATAPCKRKVKQMKQGCKGLGEGPNTLVQMTRCVVVVTPRRLYKLVHTATYHDIVEARAALDMQRQSTWAIASVPGQDVAALTAKITMYHAGAQG